MCFVVRLIGLIVLWLKFRIGGVFGRLRCLLRLVSVWRGKGYSLCGYW